MSDIKEEILFNDTGLDTDSDLRYVAHGSGRDHRNILVGEDYSNGVITQMLGNTRTVDISDHELYLSHYYKVIGSYYNRLTRKVYYFVWGHPYEIESTGGSTSTTTTTTTTTLSGDLDGLDIDYTSGSFQYDNMLLEYIEDTQELNVIFRDPRNYFGLHYDYPMRDIQMIGDWLYFNPRVSEPKMIDIVMAYNYTNYDAYDGTLPYVYGSYVTFYGGLFRANAAVGVGQTPTTNESLWDRIGDSYQNETNLNFDSEFRYAFNVIKLPPVVRPTFAYGTDTTINSNNVRGKMFRFSYRYKYFDNSYSVYSAYSDISHPPDDETWNGEVLGEENVNNYIAVTVDLHSAALIDSVEIIFQVIGEDWRRCKIINRQEQAELTTDNFIYNFYNNEAYEVFADDSTVIKIEDSVPRLANSQEIINKNILCYGGVTEGFDNLPKEDIDVTLTPVAQDIAVVFDEGALIKDNVLDNDIGEELDDSDPSEPIYYVTIDVSAWATWPVVAGDVYRIIVDGEEGTATFAGADLLSMNAFLVKMGSAVHGSFIWAQLQPTLGELWIGKSYVYPTVTISRFYIPLATATTLSKYRGFKTGAFHPFCIFYYDENLRRWDAQTSKISENTIGYTYAGTTVYIPMFTEVSPQLDMANRWEIDWTVNHLPPTSTDGSRPKYWRWGYAGNSLCSQFVQYTIKGIVDGTDEEVNMTIIDISPLQTIVDTAVATWNQFPASNISSYTWQKGDRVRFLTQKGDPTTPATDLGATVDGVIDMEIIKAVDADYTIYVQKFAWNAVGVDIGICSLIEMYTPLKETTKEIYYEFGSLMPIVEDSVGVLVHGGADDGADQDTDTDTPATGTFKTGDVYHILRTPSQPLDNVDIDQGVFHESMWWSDFYDSADWDRGKSGTESNFNERYLNIIRYSNPYFQNTQINGLPTFEALSYKELNDLFGKIVAIYESGDTLKVYQERKASSILIGRTEYSDASGNTTVAISTSILGAIRYSPSNYSTVFPESITRNNRYIYGFDIYNGVMWRDSANGIFPISGRYADAGGDSDYKMATWFKAKSEALLVSGIGHTDVMSTWDEKFKNLHVTFVDYDETLNNATIVFHEPSNRWICFEDLEQTPISHTRIVECSTYTIVQGFEGGLGYWFDEDTRFAMFDIQTPTGFTVVNVDTINMVMTANTSTVQATGSASDLGIGETITAYTPTVYITYVDATVKSMGWLSTEGGFAHEKQTTISCVPACNLTAFPAWITVADWFGDVIELNGEILDTAVINIYPTTINMGGALAGDIVLTTENGDTVTITVTQDAYVYVPNVTVELDPNDTSGMTLSSASGYNTDSTYNVYITFTPDHPLYTSGQTFDMTWQATKNGGYAGGGIFTAYDEVVNSDVHLVMSVTAYVTDTIIVYLSGESWMI